MHEHFAELLLLPLCCWLSFPLGVWVFHAAQKYWKRNNTVIRGKSGLIWSCIIFLPCHLLYNFLPNAFSPHFLLSFEDVTEWLGLQGPAGYRCKKPIPHSLIMIDPALCALGAFLTQAMGMDKSELSFSLSDFDFFGSWVLSTAMERYSEINLQHGSEYKISSTNIYSPQKKRAKCYRY